MANITGIVAEFNPFHNGHQAVVHAAREQGAGVVAVMSGNFVQRGSPAVTDKRVRAGAALHCGVDLVLELPLAFATGPAHRFARGAVGILAATGCVDGLIFGSECGDLPLLERLSHAVEDPALPPVMGELLSQGMTFAKAREQAVERLAGESLAAHLSAPNNALAIEYLRAARAVGWRPHVATIPRRGADHDSLEASAQYASASLLRRAPTDFALLQRYVHPKALEEYANAFGAGIYPADPGKLETAMLSQLRRLGPAELAKLPDLSEGLENRLHAAIRRSATLEELEQALKTKRYTMARVRRLILAAFLGITREDADTPPPYIRVLGATKTGGEILSAMKKTCALPVSHSLARLRAMGGPCEQFAALEELSTDLYALALPKPPPCGYEYTASARFLKEKSPRR